MFVLKLEFTSSVFSSVVLQNEYWLQIKFTESQGSSCNIQNINYTLTCTEPFLITQVADHDDILGLTRDEDLWSGENIVDIFTLIYNISTYLHTYLQRPPAQVWTTCPTLSAPGWRRRSCRTRAGRTSSSATAEYCTVLYCTVLYCTVLYCTVL